MTNTPHKILSLQIFFTDNKNKINIKILYISKLSNIIN